jgi:hypothetical protein
MMIVLISTLLFLFGFLYIFGFIFIHGSTPGDKLLPRPATFLFILYIFTTFIGSDTAQNNFIDRVGNPTGLLKTVLTYGYFKASFRRFIQHYKLFFSRKPIAKLGQKAPDAEIVSLDGTVLSLQRDFISKMAKDVPLILNMGSYT